MNQTNTQLKVYEELLAVALWTIQMLDSDVITHGQCSATPNGLDEFRNWETAIRAAVVKAEVIKDSQPQLKRTHADVQLPILQSSIQAVSR